MFMIFQGNTIRKLLIRSRLAPNQRQVFLHQSKKEKVLLGPERLSKQRWSII